jgi:hypothetical protein
MDYKYPANRIYKRYKDSVENPLSYSEYCKILSEFNSLLVNYIIYESVEVKLPYNLGTLRVKKYKKKINLKAIEKRTLSVNWFETKKLWSENSDAKDKKKLVYHLNEHRGGYSYKIYWDKSRAIFRNKTFYYLVPVRGFKRELASVLNNNFSIDYYE